MHVNISRSKLLINKKRFSYKPRKAKKPALRCNHCGGAIRFSGELEACLMCSRDVSHHCGACAYVRPDFVVDEKQKSA
ncbi:MAG: hypothetical protein G3M78_11080 [Candidatus Nitrohelix vancouverensis]|uniref:Uncharacterized protein n=1 Tax=Candidatus Nitrohelix vancouverensis TaxID=2705534 RepID=A0A7T0C3K2_9BACT|nr:MAG: hypothetical protein G3M78_11080 [Candidatus Nitrohelix vancouverensis]